MTDTIPKGTQVTIVKLTGDRPAKIIKTIRGHKLIDDLNCSKANHLTHTGNHDPASEYIKKGYTVRSVKEKGNWYQVCYHKKDITKLKPTHQSVVDYKSNRVCSNCGGEFYGHFCHSCCNWL